MAAEQRQAARRGERPNAPDEVGPAHFFGQDRTAAAEIELASLLKQPATRRPKSSRSHYMVGGRNTLHQIDLLELPSDNGHRYALVLIDVATRAVEARPLSNKRADTVAEAIADIYAHNDHELTWPIVASVDAGPEFRGATAEQFAAHNVAIKVGLPGRHKQQAYVEGANKELGKAIFARQYTRELLTGREDKQWVAELPAAVAALNLRWLRPPTELPEGTPDMPNPLPKQEGKDRIVLAAGTPVRVKLDRPVDVRGRTLNGTHRAADIWWTPEIHTIMALVDIPGNSLRYLVSGIPNVSYSPYELQVLSPAQVAAQKVLEEAQ